MIALLLLLAGCGADKAGRGDDAAATDDTSPATTGEGCPDDVATFEAAVWTPVLAETCVRCHMEGAPAEGTRFVLQPTSVDGWAAHNLAVTSELARMDAGDEPLLVAKPTGRTGHGGGVVVEAGSTAEQALQFWSAWARGELADCVAPAELVATCDADAPGERVLRRLTHVEYTNSVRDLLGTASDPGAGFAADDVVDGFANNAAALDVSSLLADQYRAAAEELAAEADVEALLPCDPDTLGQAACATLFVEDFGLRAWRRPLTPAEVEAWYGLWATVAAEEGPEAGWRWVVTGMLQSPHFLYRMELGEGRGDGTFALTGWEVASELSYLFWATTPDAELLDAAASGTLDTVEGRAAQVERLAADPRAADGVARLVREWLQLDRVATVAKDAETYPTFTDTVRADLLGETDRLVADVAGQGGTLSDLLLARHTYTTDALAEFYGFAAGSGEADAEGFRRVELDGATYGGLLTQGSVLATWGLPSTSSPVQRGVLIRELLLCQDLPPPPSNLDTSPPEVDPSLSTRDRYLEHSANPECALCHDLIDPIGFGFEAYDGVGRWRSDDAGHPIDASGRIAGTPHVAGEFDGVFELAGILADSPEVRRCFARKAYTWGTGVAGDAAVECSADALAATGDVALTAPMATLAGLERFGLRTGGAGEGDTPAAGTRTIPDDLPEDTGTWGPPEDNAVLTLTTSTDWGDGYCADGVVENPTDAAVIWEVHAPVSGTITTLWNANVVEADGQWAFTGVEWNATIEPGASTSFGFCASR